MRCDGTHTLRAHTARRALSWPQHLQGVSRWVLLFFLSVVLLSGGGCSSNKTQPVSESYVQSVVNLSNGLVRHLGDVSRLTRATTALQQADGLIRHAVKRRDGALKTFSEINADLMRLLNSSIHS